MLQQVIIDRISWRNTYRYQILGSLPEVFSLSPLALHYSWVQASHSSRVLALPELNSHRDGSPVSTDMAKELRPQTSICINQISMYILSIKQYAHIRWHRLRSALSWRGILMLLSPWLRSPRTGLWVWGPCKHRRDELLSRLPIAQFLWFRLPHRRLFLLPALIWIILLGHWRQRPSSWFLIPCIQPAIIPAAIAPRVYR